MNDFAALAALIEWATEDKVSTLDFCAIPEIQEAVGKSVYTHQWQAGLAPFGKELVTGPKAQTIDGAFGGLIEICRQQGIEIPEVVDSEMIIPHRQEVDILITNLSNALPKLEKDHQSLLFQYWVPLASTREAWSGMIFQGGRWSSYIELQADGDTLFEVCTKMWEECEKILAT